MKRFQKTIIFIICISLFISCFPMATTVLAAPTPILLSHKKLTIPLGQKKTLKIKKCPKKTTISIKVKNKKIIRIIRNKKIITITTKKVGKTKAIITFRYKKNQKIITTKKSCIIVVKDNTTSTSVVPPATATTSDSPTSLSTATPVATAEFSIGITSTQPKPSPSPTATTQPTTTPQNTSVPTNSPEESIIQKGYFPVSDTLRLAGFIESSKNIYQKTISSKDITLTFDYEKNICRKNIYSFSIKDSYLSEKSSDKYYIKKELLEQIINVELSYSSETITVTSPSSGSGIKWYATTPLIAHACGAVRENGYISRYTNSLEALAQNYDLGQRIIEIDLCFTSDGDLALVHDWNKFGNQNGTPLSSEEWKNFKTFGKPITDGRYTTMLIGDILDEMLVNQDMYIVTDIKNKDATSAKAFQIIYDEAIKRDASLLYRIIPQIYNEKMYDYINEIYSFPSLIFSCYATTASASQIISFCNMHDEIDVITIPYNDSRFTKKIIQETTKEGKRFYTHTINSMQDFIYGKSLGIYGFYSDELLLSDIY